MELYPVMPAKDPNGDKDYGVDWTEWLAADTILTSTWAVPTGLTKTSDSATGQIAAIWLQGGVPGEKYTVTNHITTAGGRSEDQSLIIRMKER